MSDVADSIAEQLQPHFLAGGRFEGIYDPPVAAGFAEVIPGGVWQTLVYPRGSAEARFLRVYEFGRDNADLLRAHWRNEVRALMRLSARRHPSLPMMRDAGILAGEALGYLILDDPGDPVRGDHPVAERLRSDLPRTLRDFLSVVEAVSLLHRDGMVHRTITPDSVCARRVADAAVLVDGFQMSAFVSTWLRGRGVFDDWAPGAFLPPSDWSRAFMAPERLAPLFGGQTRRIEGYGTDVFSLGMLGAWWFVGEEAFRDAESVFASGQYDEGAHQKIVRGVHSTLQRSKLPTMLRRLLVEMTEFAPANRVPSAVVAYEALCKMYGAVLAWFETTADKEPEPLRLYYLFESVERLYRDGLATSPPVDPDFQEYTDAIERDVADGIFTWCDDGFRRWQTRPNLNGESARVVIIGKHYTYFCQYLNQGFESEDRRVLVVKFPLQNGRATELRRQPLQRAVPPLTAAYFSPGARMRPIPPSVQSWQPLVDSVRSTEVADAGTPVERAGRWLLGLDAGRALAGAFPIEVFEASPGMVTLRAVERGFDESDNDSEAVAFAKLWLRVRARPSMGDHFADLHDDAIEEERFLKFEVVASPTDTDRVAQLRFVQKLDPDTVRFEVESQRGDIPAEAWVRPEDVARRIVWQRHRSALVVAAENFQLNAQLRAPRAVPVFTPSEFGEAAQDIQDEGTRDLLRKMLCAWPIFMVQGPPGTGKTFLAAHFIAEFLRHEPFARILVSAQSHHALDNLLEQVADLLTDSRRSADALGAAILLRIASDATIDKVGHRGELHLPAKVLASVVADIKTAQPADTKDLRHLQKQWRRMADHHQLDVDVGQRLHRASSVTCVSSNSATARNLRAEYESGSYDLVVLEEAARGWLTEIMVPMVHANRWLLIGDQEQLPAFAATEVTRAMSIDVDENLTGSATDSPASAELAPFLSWFGSLFESPVTTRERQIDPRKVLLVQRRMHPDIGNLVSGAFYGGKLKNHSSTKRTHRLEGAPFPSNTAFLWVDTSPLGEAAREHGFTNYCECQVLRMLIEDYIRDFPQHEESIPAVRVLTPYRDQRKKLMHVVKILPEEAFATVHSFQGRQAEVVFVSLTRNNTFDSNGRALGFLQAPELTNVMFSRARRLLVVVGSLKHFARFPGTHWEHIVRYVGNDPRFYFDPTGPEMRFRAVWRGQ